MMNWTKKIGLTLCCCLWVTSCSTYGPSRVETELPLLGHRNWIVIVDGAYPHQTSPGINTVLCDKALPDLTAQVLEAIAASAHVRPVIYMDKELAYVAEEDAPGISRYRQSIQKALEPYDVRHLPHEEIIAKLDEAGESFTVLLLKTDLALPYTSVFIELECGYWTTDAERKLRAAMKP